MEIHLLQKYHFFWHEIDLMRIVIIVITGLDFSLLDSLTTCFLLYMSYIQLIVAKDKENKKLKER